MKIKHLYLLIFFIGSLSCVKEYSTKDKQYIARINQIRADKDEFMKTDPDSPFNRDSSAVFHKLKYFDADPDWVFESLLYENKLKDTVEIFGTKGEARKAIRYGKVKFSRSGRDYVINVYKSFTKSGQEYFSVWFTDKTTGNETYSVGRYIEFLKQKDPFHKYTIDFNLAYNPYCAYSRFYSCAIPTQEDYIDLLIEVGEKKFN